MKRTRDPTADEIPGPGAKFATVEVEVQSGIKRQAAAGAEEESSKRARDTHEVVALIEPNEDGDELTYVRVPERGGRGQR